MNVLAYSDLIDDPRQGYKVIYPLTTLLFTTLCAILCGCQSWHDVEDYCYSKRKWLSQYIDLSMGIPSSWTFRRLFTLLDPLIVETLLKEIAVFLLGRGKSDHIVIDGKALKGSGRHDARCLKSVSAWCHEHGLILAEKAVAQGAHESKAIHLLLEVLSLKGATVSIDAAG